METIQFKNRLYFLNAANPNCSQCDLNAWCGQIGVNCRGYAWTEIKSPKTTNPQKMTTAKSQSEIEHEILVKYTCIAAAFQQAGGSVSALHNMTVQDFVIACVKNGIDLKVSVNQKYY